MPNRGSLRAVFLGRDGVLNDDRGQVSRPEDFRWIPGAIEALAALKEDGWRLVVVTNQPGIARGLFGPGEYDNLAAWMESELSRHGVKLDGIYHCPHLPDAPLAAWCRQCECRMPSAGMLRRAARDLDLDLAASAIVGSRPEDVHAGRTAGLAACIRIVGGEGPASADIGALPPDHNCASLAEAAEWLLPLTLRHAPLLRH